MLTVRIEHLGPGVDARFVTDPDLASQHPDVFASAVCAYALAGRIEQRWPGDGSMWVEPELLAAVGQICGRDLAAGDGQPNLANVRSAMRRWALKAQHATAALGPAA